MRQFVDIDGERLEEGLPSEALNIEGEYLENVVEGYRTLYVKGREESSVEIESVDLLGVDGANYINSRLEPREIVIGFQMESESSIDLRNKFRILNTVLMGGKKKKRLIFRDEQGYFYEGIFKGVEGVTEARLNVKGEIVFWCPDPYSYSVRLQRGSSIQTEGYGLRIERIETEQEGLRGSDNTTKNYVLDTGDEEIKFGVDYRTKSKTGEFVDGITNKVYFEMNHMDVRSGTTYGSGEGVDLNMMSEQPVSNDYEKMKVIENPRPYIETLNIEAKGLDVGDKVEVWAREVRV